MSGGIDERKCGAMWRRHVQQWRRGIVQCMCRWILWQCEQLNELELQRCVSGRLCVYRRVGEWYGDAVWCGSVQHCSIDELCGVSGGSVRQWCRRWSGLQRCV